MMRRVILAALMLTPVLLHAQASSAGQPLRADLEAPNVLNVAASKSDAAVTIHRAGVSTGIVAPKLASAIALEYDETHVLPVVKDRKFIVNMTVDPSGTPQDVNIVDSPYGLMNRSVVDAVSHAHFIPGTVNNQPTSVPLTLELVVRAAKQ